MFETWFHLTMPIEVDDSSVNLRSAIEDIMAQTSASFNSTKCAWFYNLISASWTSTVMYSTVGKDCRVFGDCFKTIVKNNFAYDITERNIRLLELNFWAGYFDYTQKNRLITLEGSIDDQLNDLVRRRLIFFLSSGWHDLCALAVVLAERWWLCNLANDSNEMSPIHETIMPFAELYSAVLIHCDSDDTQIIRQVRQFLSSILLPTLDYSPQLTEKLFSSILKYPLCKSGCVLLDKCAINLLIPVLQKMRPATKLNRRESFVSHCLGRRFCTISLSALPQSFQVGSASSLVANISLADWLLRHLCRSDDALKVPVKRSFEHQLFMWLNLFASHGDKITLLRNNLDLSLLLTGLVHADDRIRSLSLSGLSSLCSAVLSQREALEQVNLCGLSTSVLDLGSLFWVGILLLNTSPNPAARKALICAFYEFVRSARNACSSVRPATINDFVPDRILCAIDRSWLIDTALVPLTSFPISGFGGSSSVTRQKLAFDWLDSLVNLRKLFRHLSAEFDWPFDAPEMLESFLRNLPVMKPDVQTQLFQLIEQNWPRSIQLASTKSIRNIPFWLKQAMQWSDSHLWAMHTAGANLLSFLITRGYWMDCDQLIRIDLVFSEKLRQLCDVFQTDSSNQNRLLSTAQSGTGLGYLMALDHIFASLLHYRSFVSIREHFPPALIQFLMSDTLASLCLMLCNHCLSVMGCQPWTDTNFSSAAGAVKGAPSFRELSQSILRSVFPSLCPDSDLGMRSEQPLIENIELLPEYQHVLSWSWNTLRLCCNILAQWCAFGQKQRQEEEQEQRPQQQHTKQRYGDTVDNTIMNCNVYTRVGFQLVHVLLHCRHRGTVESVCDSLQLYLTAAGSSLSSCVANTVPDDDCHSGVVFTDGGSYGLITCEQVLDVCWEVLCRGAYSVTRRAAGLWPAIKAALLAERARGARSVPNLLISWLERLLRLTANSVNDNLGTGEEMTDSPRVLALHILRGLVADSRLHAYFQSFLSEDEQSTCSFVVESIRQAVLPGFAAPEWTVSNAALQLHSALVLRLTGSNSGRPAPSATVVFRAHHPLLDLCVERFEWLEHSDRDPGWIAVQLLPLLTLIMRMAPSSGASLPQSARLRNTLQSILLHNKSAAVRQLSASAYLVFLPQEMLKNSSGDIDEWEQITTSVPCAHCIFSNIGPWPLVDCPRNCCSIPVTDNHMVSANAAHGQLCLLRSWYEQPVPAELVRARQRRFRWCTALDLVHYLLNGPRVGPGLWLLASLLCELMIVVLDACDCESELNILRPLVRTWFGTKMARFFHNPQCQPLYINAGIALARFVHRVHPEILSHTPVDLTSWPPQLVHRLLGALTDSDVTQDTVLFAEPCVRYWIRGGESRTTEWMLFSWRVTQIWARAIQDQLTGDCEQGVCLEADLSHRALELLRTVLAAEDTGSADAGNRSSALLCEASCMKTIFASSSFDQLDRWFDRLTDCSHPSSPESARITSSEAMLVWLGAVETTKHSHRSVRYQQMLPVGIRHKFLSFLFSGIFDECMEVRRNCARSVLLSLPENRAQTLPLLEPGLSTVSTRPVAPLIAVTLLLEELLPDLFSDCSPEKAVDWLQVEWKRIMASLNRRLVEEALMRERNVLYEREADNEYCEPRLLLELLAKKLLPQCTSDDQWHAVREALLSDAENHLSALITANRLTEDIRDVRGSDRPVELMSSTQFARYLGLCLLNEPREQSIRK
ncbi:hypothetical protein FGIG_00700 [Fasciola gigantica]|uniref:Uncharacterized protein n=1 Tax=Fasciola gigantica TaxID=46835 RepID=A0A504YGJ7_FASGI|nr:hypothetical protein FGIG_00700 [Fasciola gigantica]